MIEDVYILKSENEHKFKEKIDVFSRLEDIAD